MSDEVFMLTKGMEINYIALQNFLNGITVKRGKTTGCKNAAQKRRKVRALARQDFKCADCGTLFKPNMKGEYPKATRDHVIPKRHGSVFCHNSQYVCGKCNGKRSDNPLPFILSFFGTIV